MQGLVDVIYTFIHELDEAFNVGDLELVKSMAHSIAGALEICALAYLRSLERLR